MKYPNNYWKQPKFIFFCDLETTGFDQWRNEILTLSMSCFNYEKLEPQGEIELNFKLQNIEYWGDEAEKIHGITIRDALEFEPKKESTLKLNRFINSFGDHNVFCCHASKRKGGYFDWLFLRTHFSKCNLEFDLTRNINKLESTIDFYKYLVKEQKVSVDNYKLNTICETLGVELNHHEAKSDRVACEKIYKYARAI